MKLSTAFAVILMLLSLSVAAFDMDKWAMHELVSAQQKAIDDFKEGRLGLVGIIVRDGEEVPAQDQAVDRNLPVRFLNNHWHHLADIEKNANVLLNARAFALRYNLKMLKLLKQQEYQDRMKYRY